MRPAANPAPIGPRRITDLLGAAYRRHDRTFRIAAPSAWSTATRLVCPGVATAPTKSFSNWQPPGTADLLVSGDEYLLALVPEFDIPIVTPDVSLTRLTTDVDRQRLRSG